MPTLAEIHDEIGDVVPAADVIRRKHLAALAKLTGRPTILYASSFAVKPAPAEAIQVGHSDVQAFMSALVGVEGDSLDLILHSPGGSAEAAEQIVNYLRAKFSDIRVIVPQNAMSAATMIACAADRIVMGKHSALGPIDPQIVSDKGAVAAKSLLDEFNEAREAIAKGDDPALWVDRLMQIGPGMLSHCVKVISLSKTLVADWLASWMFRGNPEARAKATAIAEWLGNDDHFFTHGRAIGIGLAAKRGLIVDALEKDQEFQSAVLSVYHAAVATFQRTACAKIVENHLGRGSYMVVSKV